MKNLRIALKFAFSFGGLLLLLAVVALWSVFGIRGIVGNAGEVIDGNKLNGMLVQREVDHLKWAEKVNSLLTDDSVTELKVQTDDHKCGMGKWLYGEGRKEAEKLLPSLALILKSIEEPHRKLHESAIDVGDTFEQADVSLPAKISEIEAAHLNWANKAYAAVINKSTTIEKFQTDSSKCILGKFINSAQGQNAYERGDTEFKQIWDSIHVSHEAMHKAGENIKELLANEQFNGAAQVLQNFVMSNLAITVGKLKKLREKAQHDLNGMGEANEIYASQTVPALHEVQDILAEAKTEVRSNIMTDEAMIAAASKTNMAVIIISVIALGVGLIVAFFMSRTITVPLAATVAMIKEMSKGHISKRLQLNRGDEIGQMADAMDGFSDDLEKETVGALTKLAEGDLTFDATPKDDEDAIGNALKKTGEDLNNVITEIQMAAEQIATGSGQVSDASQSLSQGASESAASLEQITSSMTEMAAQTKTNAESSGQANQLAGRARDAAEKGNGHMGNLVKAIDEINESGQNISKIIKVIDEIAFQTNLLALNAAVEAARAGKHGKGFAVVAEEVRNLAARSAKAAQETAELIEGSVEKAKNGSEIAGQTSEALAEIVSGATKVTDLVGEIAAASNEQAQGISQVNQGLTQIEQVTQQNTASAEECAAASEGLSSQAMHMQRMMTRFKIKEQGTMARNPVTQCALPHHELGEQAEQLSGTSSSPKRNDVIDLDDQEFGKY
jgi:methyl-accepting chemotaxis protein